MTRARKAVVVVEVEESDGAKKTWRRLVSWPRRGLSFEVDMAGRHVRSTVFFKIFCECSSPVNTSDVRQLLEGLVIEIATCTVATFNSHPLSHR